ncbi:unnamed protein product [Brachionus calyciflorus]|uniref:Uncharacterized protein n=1 Tax=Brachionus calyciflorus TaxID=104777 RepID=A0A814S407_9BILA|nr:unnamed protein product [Brachionus calyciflorus]
MVEPVPPHVIKDMEGYRRYFNTKTPKGKSNIIFAFLSSIGVIGYGYWNYNRKDRFMTMKTDYPHKQ